MQNSRRLFGTNGIRGIPGKDLTIDFVSSMGLSIGNFFNSGNILIGHDTRSSSLPLTKALSAGIMESGVNVTNAGLAPTPALQLLVKTQDYCGGVAITASHNPPEYNGIKVINGDGIEISREDERNLENIYFSGENRRADWNNIGVSKIEQRGIDIYKNSILENINSDEVKSRKFKIVLDPGNGAQSIFAPYIFEQLGCEVIVINGHPDGNFSGRGGEPTPTSLLELSKTVVEYGADLGVGYDGDGDRSIFCDDKGNVFWGDKSGTLICNHILNKHGIFPIITTLATSQIIDDIASKHNAEVIRTKVGSIDVSHEMKAHDSYFGFEENGGCFYSPHLTARDGAMTTALMLETLSKHDESLSTLISDLPVYYQSKTKFQCTVSKRNSVIDIIKQNTNKKFDDSDGLKIWQDEKSWVLIRPSGTEPIIRLFGESNTKEKLDSVMSFYSDKITSEII